MRIYLFISLALLPFFSFSQIENFDIDLGNFFSQGYGGATDEEAIDITEFPANFVFTGWKEITVEETTTKDLVYYVVDKTGKLLIENSIGTNLYDEIGTGIIKIDADHFALSSYVTNNFKPSKFSKVSNSDQLKVHYVDLSGNLVWTYSHSSENGLAPVDIRFFGSHI